VPSACAKSTKACVDELSHLIGLKDVLFGYLVTHIVVFFVLLQKRTLSPTQYFEESSLKP